MVTEYISQAWNAYRKNFWQIIGSMALFFAIAFALIFVSVLPLMASLSPALKATDANIAIESISGSQMKNVLSPADPYLLAAGGIMLIVAMLVIWALGAGLIRVFADALKGKARLEAMFSAARHKFWTVAAANLIVTVFMILLYAGALAISLLLSGASSLMFLAYLVLLMIPIALVAILFSLANQSIVIGGCGAVDSVRKSVSIVKKNYLQFLGLVVLLILLTMLISFVPILGSLINFFVMTPLTALAYTAFYMKNSRAERRKTAAKRKAIRKRRIKR